MQILKRGAAVTASFLTYIFRRMYQEFNQFPLQNNCQNITTGQYLYLKFVEPDVVQGRAINQTSQQFFDSHQDITTNINYIEELQNDIDNIKRRAV